MCLYKCSKYRILLIVRHELSVKQISEAACTLDWVPLRSILWVLSLLRDAANFEFSLHGHGHGPTPLVLPAQSGSNAPLMLPLRSTTHSLLLRDLGRIRFNRLVQPWPGPPPGCTGEFGPNAWNRLSFLLLGDFRFRLLGGTETKRLH